MAWMLLLLGCNPRGSKVYAWAPSHGSHTPWHRGHPKFKGKSVVDWYQDLNPVIYQRKGRKAPHPSGEVFMKSYTSHPDLSDQPSENPVLLLWMDGDCAKEDIRYAGYARVTNSDVFATGPIPENLSAWLAELMPPT